MPDLILASASAIRHKMLVAAALDVELRPVSVDEAGLRAALAQDGASPRDMADALAEAKARRCAGRYSQGFVLGCDQILDHAGRVLAKPQTRDEARQQLLDLRGQTHRLWSAAVLYQDGAPIWRHIGEARLTMRAFSDSYLSGYLDRNWPAVSESVGGYRIEDEGIRLFSAISGDHFTILGLPLIPLLQYLSDRGAIAA
ncbi:MAG: Maf family protein [Pseudomonadota bacterium]